MSCCMALFADRQMEPESLFHINLNIFISYKIYEHIIYFKRRHFQFKLISYCLLENKKISEEKAKTAIKLKSR